MTGEKELKLAYGLAAVLLVVGILSYTAFSAKAPEEPVRIMFKCAAGKVLYDHKIHTDDSGYGYACGDCHHHPEGGEELSACGECHVAEPDPYDPPQYCLDCHDATDIEGMEMMKRSDAFHSQCIGCHKDIDAGPQECSSCHVM